MNFHIAESLLRAVDLDVDLDVCAAGRPMTIRGRRGHYEVRLQNWMDLFQLIRLLRRYRLGWRDFWRRRRFLNSGNRRLSVIIKERRRFTMGR